MDVGDLIFFLIFVMIIISNIVKQAKKAKEKEKARQSGKPGGPAQAREKKTGWKDLLGQMLEEAQRQMEKAEGDEGKAPDRKAPTGWEAITGESDRKPARSGKPAAARPTAPPTPKAPRPPVISEGESGEMREPPKFRPRCMACNAAMKEITDYGTGKQTGLVYCDSCGEPHRYQISTGRLNLMRISSERQTLIPPEDRVSPLTPSPAAAGASRFASPEALGPAMKIPLSLSRDGLKNAVVWAEILGPPRALKDLEF